MLAASIDFDISTLTQLKQDELDKTLKFDVFKSCLKLSKNGKIFVWKCLQISPKDRLTVIEAGCHDWLCTPEKHLEFFTKLDRRILADWHPPKYLQPMPLQIPSVLLQQDSSEDLEIFWGDRISVTSKESQYEMVISQHFGSSLPPERSNVEGVPSCVVMI